MQIMKELFEMLVEQKMKERQARLFAIDRTDILGFSFKDRDAKFGNRTLRRWE